MNTYSKKLLSVEQQLEAYKTAGMIINSDDEARTALQNIGYYRLRGYCFHLYDNNAKKYLNSVNFSNILKLYEFDTELSHLIFSMTTKIEVSLRSRLIDALLIYNDALIWSEPSIYSDKQHFYQNLSAISSEIARSSDVFIQHHFHNYDGDVPIWAAVEVMSFGTLSKTINNLKTGTASAYAVLSRHYCYTSQRGNLVAPSLRMFSSWVRSTVILRNMCAHNSRIYNRTINTSPQLLRVDQPTKKTNRCGLYQIILAMKYLSPSSKDWSEFKNDLTALFKRYESIIELNRLNFPTDWETHLNS